MYAKKTSKCSFKILIMLALLACLSLLAHPVQAKDTIKGPIEATVIRVIDGDTIDVKAKIWLDQAIEVRVRLSGVDAPEMKGKCAIERQKAQRAKDALHELIMDKQVTLYNVQYGKYAGRVIADVRWQDQQLVDSFLISNGLARSYDGGKRQSWC